MIGPTYSTIKAAFQLVCQPGNTTLDWEETGLALQAVGFGKLNQFQVTDAVQHAKIKSEHEIENKDSLAIKYGFSTHPHTHGGTTTPPPPPLPRSFQEFEAMVNEKVRQGGQKAEVHLAFQLFDHDKTGKVSVNNISMSCPIPFPPPSPSPCRCRCCSCGLTAVTNTQTCPPAPHPHPTVDVARDLGDLAEDDETARHSIEHYVHMASGGGSGLSLDQWSKVMGVPLKSE